MKKHVRDRISLGAAAAIVLAVVVVALVALSRTDPPTEPDERLAFTTPRPTADTPTPPARTLPPPRLFGTQDLPDPGPARPPRPGTYYVSETPGDPEHRNNRRVLEITDAGGGRQKELLDGELLTEVEWRADGKYSLKTTFGQPEGTVCEWEPEIRVVKLPLAKGEWDRQASCDLFPGARIETAGTSRLVGLAHVKAAGEDLIVWVIRTESSIRYAGEKSSITQKVTQTDHFSPKHGLTVRTTEHVTGGDPAGGKDVDRITVRRLVSLNPA